MPESAPGRAGRAGRRAGRAGHDDDGNAVHLGCAVYAARTAVHGDRVVHAEQVGYVVPAGAIAHGGCVAAAFRRFVEEGGK